MSIRNFRIRRGYEPPNIEPSKYPHLRWQVPVAGLKPFNQRLREIQASFNEITEFEPIDIGIPYSLRKNAFTNKLVKKRPELESSARKRTLLINTDEISSSNEDLTLPIRIMNVARHFSVYDDLFGKPHFFVPQTPLQLAFNIGEDLQIPIKNGNKISANNCQNEPHLLLESLPKDRFWTLIMTSPDEPLCRSNSEISYPEYLHWMVCNIKSDDINSGRVLVPYMPPIPYYGTGFHRYILILYAQEDQKIDFNDIEDKPLKGDPNNIRGFSTKDFYKKYEDKLTPAGLSFFQSTWDISVRNYFWYTLDYTEPIFEIDFPEDLPPPQTRHPKPNSWHYPRRHPDGHPHASHRFAVHEDVSFDVYLDRYRDRKEMMQEIVEERLKNEGNPLNENESSRQKVPFPMGLPIPEEFPSWRKEQEKLRRLRKGRWRELDGYEQET